MNYAIIAAGKGERLSAEKVQCPKPLVDINGQPMVKRLIDIFLRNRAESITIIVNEEMKLVSEYIKKLDVGIPINLIIKSTESSLHSFYELSKCLPKGKCCLTTVDTIFKESEFKTYIDSFIDDSGMSDAFMGVTSYIDDESPLYVDIDSSTMKVLGFLDDSSSAQYVSGGIYGLTPKCLEIAQSCINKGVSRMRNYQRELLLQGLNVKAFAFSKIIDVDHFTDIHKAEAFLKEVQHSMDENNNVCIF